MKKIFLALLTASSFMLTSCEEVIDLKLDKGDSQLAVDALVAVNDGKQKIRLTLTRAYFDNQAAVPASGAQVEIQRRRFGSPDTVFKFTEIPGTGDYISDSSLYGNLLDAFELKITYNGNIFSATSLLPRRQQIDSLKQVERSAEFGNEPGTYLDLFSLDPRSSAEYPLPDFFWLRYNYNGLANRQPKNLTVGADASFNPGVADGLPFIYPVRNSINNSPFQAGDTIGVELVSIDAENYRFLSEAQTQMNNSGLFAQPAANVKGNILNKNTASNTVALGCFGMCQISRKGIRIKK